MKELGLFILAILIFFIVFPIGFTVQFVWNLARIDLYLYKVAIQIDRTGNVFFPEFLDLLFINKKLGHRFGNNETISCVIGLNAQTNTLSALGRLLYSILGEAHCIKAIFEEYHNK